MKEKNRSPVRFAGPLAKLVFFGNFFYGLCAVALATEASLQMHFPLNRPVFYVLLFCVTVLYYGIAYTSSELSADIYNERAAWYREHARLVKRLGIALVAILLAASIYFVIERYQQLSKLSAFEWLAAGIFPVLALLYYGTGSQANNINLRAIGWMKPFTIGFIWAGLVTVYPILFYCIDHDQQFVINWRAIFLFIKNFMFVTVLCIIFDIKDYAMDYNARLKTFVVKYGLRRTIWLLVIPLSLAGLASFLVYASLSNFPMPKILINTIPFIGVILVSYGLHRRKGIFYYLVVIDGLMLVKAACGILAVTFFP